MNDDKEKFDIQEERVADEVADEILTINDDEYEQRSFWFIVLFLFCLIFLVSSLSFAVFDTYYNDNGNNVINVGVDEKTTTCEKNCDNDNDGKCDYNCDTNNDGVCDYNCDIDKDGTCDKNCDVDNNGTCNYNCDTNNDGVCDKNCDTDKNGKCDYNCDTDHDGKCDYNCDTNNDRVCDYNCDTDNDGVCNKNCDVDNNGTCDYNCYTNNDEVCNKNCDTNNDGVCDKNCDNSFKKPDYTNTDNEGESNKDKDKDKDDNTNQDNPKPSEPEIDSGSVLFSFNQSSNYISMTNVFPTFDNVGKKLTGNNQYFDFNISATLSKKNRGNLVYEISLIPSGNNTIPEDMVRVYLTEEGKDVLIHDNAVNNYNELTDSTYRSGGKLLYRKTISESYKGNYVFRMWLSSKAPVYKVSKRFGVKIAVDAYYK